MNCNAKMIVITCVYLTLIISEANCFAFNNAYGRIKSQPVPEGLGSPLILTPLLKEGRIDEAREASSVSFNEFGKIKSFSGYFTVDESYNSNLFFWFFPAEEDYLNAPIIIWLQGGPGASSLIGLFTENGPFVLKKGQLKFRQYSWTRKHSVIYFDNPVGTSYSFTDDGGYAQNETVIGDHLYVALDQFLYMFPELQKNGVFLAGESYGGKFAPAFGYAIHKNNVKAQRKINLQGITIGNGFCAPEYQMDYSDYFYQIGLLDIKGWEKFRRLEDTILENIRNKEWTKATIAVNDLIIGDVTDDPTLFKNLTDFDNYFNFLISNSTQGDVDDMSQYVQRFDVRQAIHVGDAIFHEEKGPAKFNLIPDMMRSTTEMISELLSHYRILFYSGQLDLIVPYPLTENLLRNLHFDSAEEYQNAERNFWYVNSQLAGYIKRAGNLSEILVRNSGHMVPSDQPKWALDLITRFTRKLPFDTK